MYRSDWEPADKAFRNCLCISLHSPGWTGGPLDEKDTKLLCEGRSLCMLRSLQSPKQEDPLGRLSSHLDLFHACPLLLDASDRSSRSRPFYSDGH